MAASSGCGSPGVSPLPSDPAAAGWAGALGPPRGLASRWSPVQMLGWEGMPPVHPFTPPEALPKQPVAAAGGDRHGLTWNFAAWSLSVSGLAICCFHCSFPLNQSPAAAGTTSPLCWPDGAGPIVHSRCPGCHQRARWAIGRGVRVNSCSTSGCCPRVKAARQWSMMQQDLPLLLAFQLPSTDAVHHDAVADPCC